MERANRWDRWLLVLVISVLAIVILTLYFFSPLIDGIVMGVVFAYVGKPIKSRMEKYVGSFMSSVLSTLLITIPLFVFFFYGLFQGLNQLVFILTNQEALLQGITTILRDAGLEERYIIEVERFIPTFYSIVQENVKISAFDVTKKFVMFVMNFIISAIVCFYTLQDVDRFISKLLTIVPDSRRDELKKFVDEVDRTFVGLWFGNFVVAMLIGMASIPFFLAFSIPYTPLLSGLMFLAALIPVFAEWMVLAPVAIYLLFRNLVQAIWFTILGVTFLYFIPEVILRPQFVGYTARIHPLVLLLAFLGGALVGGVSGFFLAPMVAGVLTATYNYYTSETSEVSED
jgi:predicted PurR-regulated permease PerM